MDDGNWVELEKKPMSIGPCSRGFLIDKKYLRLEANKVYKIKIQM